jgi:hypothetical protein
MHAKYHKMNAKKLMVSFLAVALVLTLVATVSAATDIADSVTVEVDGEDAYFDDLSVVAGETVEVRVAFNALADASDVTVKAEIEGNKVDVSDVTSSFDIENGMRYVKKLSLEVPYELKDDLSDDILLTVTIKEDGSSKTVLEYALRVQRPSYNANVMSIVTPNSVEAGENFPVDVVLKNVGYNDLDDLYVSAKITALDGVERTVYFGDLVALEDDEDDDDDESETTNGRIFLEMPFDVEAGVYVLKIEVFNDDLEVSKMKQIVVENEFPSKVMKAGNDLLIVNPTEKLKVYKVVFPDTESFVTVSAGSSKTVEVTPTSEDYTVNVLTMNGELVDSFTFQAVEKASVTSPIVVLTVILAIIFLVLLVVLIVLIGKKPEKAEEFGESYY